jgi:hypothetical protein
MECTREIFERLDIRICTSELDIISYSTFEKMMMIDKEKRESDNRCKGYYKKSGERCRTRINGYCKKHINKEKSLDYSKPIQLPLVETETEIEIEIEIEKNRENYSNKIINNLIYKVYENSGHVYKDDIYIGKYNEINGIGLIESTLE